MPLLNYLETCNQQEKERIENELKKLYLGALEDQNNCFAEIMKNKRSHKARNNYFEAVQRLGAIQDVFDIFHIDFMKIQSIN